MKQKKKISKVIIEKKKNWKSQILSPGVPAGLLFLLLLFPFSKQANSSEEGILGDELLLFPNMGNF